MESTSGLPDFRVRLLAQVLSDELRRYRAGDRFVSRLVVRNKKITLYRAPRVPDALRALPTVILNATADVRGIEALFRTTGSGSVQSFGDAVALHPDTKVTYYPAANYTKSALEDNPKLRHHWLDLMRNFVAAQDGGRTLIVATKKGEQWLIEGLEDLIDGGRVSVGHYGALSGLNDYNDFNVVILAQPYNPKPGAAASYYRALYGGTPGPPLCLDPAYATEVISDGKVAYEVDVVTLKDERLRPIYEHLRWAEMYQAAHRVRPILYPREIIITCAIPLRGLAPTMVVYQPRPVGRPSNLPHLLSTVTRILATQEYVTCRQIADAAKVTRQNVAQHVKAICQTLGLETINVAARSERYPNGRAAKASARVRDSS